MPSLILCSQNPNWKPDTPSTFESLLSSKGLIAATSSPHREGGAAEYVAGEHFLSLIMFLGCSPQVDLKTQIFIRYCDGPEFISSRRRPAVRCPKCRASVKPFISVSHNELTTCLKCGKAVSENNLDWRQAATWASCYIEIAGIYPHEAVPADALLKTLQGYTRENWRTVYIE